MKYKKNFDEFANEQQSNFEEEKSRSRSPKNKDQSIASPKLMTKLSPINQYAKDKKLVLNPKAQKNLLKFAASQS
jgi:hypothetical protein